MVTGVAETGTMPTTECHGCLGKGWVEVSSEQTETKSNLPYNFPDKLDTNDYNKQNVTLT